MINLHKYKEKIEKSEVILNHKRTLHAKAYLSFEKIQ